MNTLLIATRNKHKVHEIRGILGGFVRYLTLRDFPSAPAVVEDAPTFAGNASKKSSELARWLAAAESPEFGVPDFELSVLADDSGLEVDALGGAPGVHSARFAALDQPGQGNAPDADNNAKLLRLLKDVPAEKRTARFRCVIALTPVRKAASGHASPDCPVGVPALRTELFEGTCEGRIGFEARGKNGFGYDPLFLPEGFAQTFAELGDVVKNQLSHRAKALMKLRQQLDHR